MAIALWNPANAVGLLPHKWETPVYQPPIYKTLISAFIDEASPVIYNFSAPNMGKCWNWQTGTA